jgi:5-methylthioadenosine/S-adenosylhomocysteine deaminase
MRDEQFPTGINGRLLMGIALRGPCFTSPERNAQDFAFARELGLPISLHVGMAGTADAVTTLQQFGLLGADVNYAHGNMLTDEEFDLIAASHGTLSITPSADMLMQFGTYPGTGRALGHGIVCGFGVDTICSAGTDLFSGTSSEPTSSERISSCTRPRTAYAARTRHQHRVSDESRCATPS